MPGPRQKRKYVSGNPIKRRIKSTAVKGAKAVGKSRINPKTRAFGKAVTTGRAINPFVSAALKAAKGLKSAKGRSNNQHLQEKEMPKVGKRKFPYTKTGMAAARKAKKTARAATKRKRK